MRDLPDRELADDEPHGRWRTLLEEIARIDDQLAAGYLEQIDDGARYYDGVPDKRDLTEQARNAFRFILGSLLAKPLSAELITFPAAVGALRARQGVALENLTAAVRNDFLVMWAALMRRADDADMAVLAMHVGQLWKAVDDFAGAVQQGYLDQRLQMTRTDVIEQQQSLSDLFTGEPTATMVRRAAEILGIDESASYWVVGLDSELTGDGIAVRRRLAGLDVPALEHTSGGVTLILLPDRRRWADDTAVAAELLAGLVGAVATRSVKLPNVFRAAETVRMLVRSGAQAATLRRYWPRLSVGQLCTVIDDLRSYVDGPLEAMADRGLLIETVLAFAECGSISTTAAKLYCHRNTVLNRIRKFEDATGIYLRTPRSQAMVQLYLLRP